MEARRTSSPSRAFETGPRPPPPPPSQLSSCCLSRCLRSCLRSRMRTPQPSSPDTLSAPTAMEIERRPPWSQGARTPHPRCADLRGACKPTARCRSPRVQALRVGEGVGDTEPSPLVPLSFHASPRPALKRAATNARGCARSLRSGVRDSDGTGLALRGAGRALDVRFRARRRRSRACRHNHQTTQRMVVLCSHPGKRRGAPLESFFWAGQIG